MSPGNTQPDAFMAIAADNPAQVMLAPLGAWKQAFGPVQAANLQAAFRRYFKPRTAGR